MKKIVFIIILIIIVTGCTKKEIIEYKEENIEKSNISILEPSLCNNKPIKYYKDDVNIYTYCIDSIKIENEDKEYELKDYLKRLDTNSLTFFNDLVKKMNQESILLDGGTAIYKNSDITIIKCNTIDGNKDIYIGNSSTNYKQNFCKNDNYTFTKTYKIKDIKMNNNIQYEDGVQVGYSNSFKVTLIDNKQNTNTVIINNLFDTLEVDLSYEFEFMFNDNSKNNDENDTDYIFKNAYIVEIRKVEYDKAGTANYLYSLKNESINSILENFLFELYGKYNIKINNKKLTINYYELEGYGNILNYSDVIYYKTALLFTLIDDIDEIEYNVIELNQKNNIKREYYTSEIGNLTEYGKSEEKLNELLKKLNFYKDSDPITIKIVDYNESMIKYEVSNKSNRNYLFGEDYIIKKKNNDKWEDIDDVYGFVNAIGYILNDTKREMNTYFNIKLSNGTYRFTKVFKEIINQSNNNQKYGKTYYISTYFTIN